MFNIETNRKLQQLRKSILVVDIETSSLYSDGEEVNLRTNYEDYISRAKVKWFGAFSYKNNQQYYLNAQEDAKLILTLLKEHTIIVSFNGDDFDWPILVNNGYTDEKTWYIQVDCMQILGTATSRNRKGYAFKNKALLMDYKLKNNSLKHMAEVFKLEHKKGDIDYKIFIKDTWTKEETKEIIDYLSNDVMATKQLFDKIWDYWYGFTELLPEKSVLDLSWIRSSIASLSYKCACNVLGEEPTYAEAQGEAEAMGGNVYLPTQEESRKVWAVDFASLYPHIISQFNLCAEISKDDLQNYEKVWHGNDLFNVKGYYNISKWHPLSKYIAEKLKERAYLKEHDKLNPMVYTLKILANSFYGITRNPIFEKVHTPNIGWDTCSLGQQIQQFTKEMLEQFGFEVIMGDTDSLFFISKIKDLTKEEVTNYLSQIVSIIKENVPFPIDTFNIAIEKYIDYLMVPFEEQPIIDLETGKNKKEKNRLVKERKAKKKCYLYIYKDEN